MGVAVEVTDVAGCKLIRLCGHVDHGLAERLGEGLAKVCSEDRASCYIVDLSEIPVIDLVLVTALTEPLRDVIMQDRVFMVCPRLSARKTLRRAPCAPQTYPSVDDAVQAQRARTQ